MLYFKHSDIGLRVKNAANERFKHCMIFKILNKKSSDDILILFLNIRASIYNAKGVNELFIIHLVSEEKMS